MIDKQYSITSNEVKMYKHMDNLKKIQDGIPSPVLAHISPTNLCNLNCIHCCFSERDKKISLDYELLTNSIDQFYNLGVRAVEFTGGGEPVMYSKINEAINYIVGKGMKLGMNTNALSIEKITEENWEKFQWVRVALNVFDSGSKQRIETFKENVKYLQNKTKITACYISPKELGTKNIDSVIGFANKNNLMSRLAPDCIQSREGIKELTDKIRTELGKYKDNESAFLSDFNIYLFDREDDVCLMHMWKPFLYTDGWVYTCPSSELAIENNKTMQPEYRVCKAEDIEDYYKNNFDIFNHSCSYCKYAKQNEILNSLLTEVEDAEFA